MNVIHVFLCSFSPFLVENHKMNRFIGEKFLCAVLKLG